MGHLRAALSSRICDNLMYVGTRYCPTILVKERFLKFFLLALLKVVVLVFDVEDVKGYSSWDTASKVLSSWKLTRRCSSVSGA